LFPCLLIILNFSYFSYQGPWNKDDGAQPDLRNLDLATVGCDVGDLLIVCSDGVHDNFDPQVLGILFSPSLLVIVLSIAFL